MTLLKDLIDIPEHVQKGDFVLHLSEGVVDPAGTLGEYVVTPELVKCFDQALDFVRDAVTRRTSKATYLHGSFGSGKSPFMAVLHLILLGNPQARSISELAGIIARHNAWMTGKKFLLVPHYMIGAHSLESGILSQYPSGCRNRRPWRLKGLRPVSTSHNNYRQRSRSPRRQRLTLRLEEMAGEEQVVEPRALRASVTSTVVCLTDTVMVVSPVPHNAPAC